MLSASEVGVERPHVTPGWLLLVLLLGVWGAESSAIKVRFSVCGGELYCSCHRRTLERIHTMWFHNSTSHPFRIFGAKVKLAVV